MPDSSPLAKAQLIELNPDVTPKGGGKITTVQFNPDSLKVSFANQIAQPQNAGSGASGGNTQVRRQYVGAGTTKLALTLWFDVGSQDPSASTSTADVRDLTKNVAYFITPKAEGEQFVPPVVRFQWGSFSFEGIVDSMDETLEYFSSEGVPLRASVGLAMSQQRISEFNGNQQALNSSKPPPGVPSLGTQALTAAPSGSTLQGLNAGFSASASWQAVAEANGIENPRMIEAGKLINLNVKIGK